MHRLKRNVRKGAQFFSLAALFLLCFMGVESWGQASGSPQKTGSRLESVLTLTDVINLALRANRSLISSTYGVENRKYSLNAAQSEFEWKLIPGADARATDDTSSVGAGGTPPVNRRPKSKGSSAADDAIVGHTCKGGPAAPNTVSSAVSSTSPSWNP